MGKVMLSGVAPQMKAPCTYDPVFENNTWEEIISACQSKNIPNTWVVGSQKTMNINGTDYAIDVIGNNHDDYSDDSGKAPLTFQLHNSYNDLKRMYNTNSTSAGWEQCEMRQTHLPNILSLMPQSVNSAIKQVKKKTSIGSGSSTIGTTDDKLFLLSEIEIFGYSNNSAQGEGNQYEYYKAGNSKVKTANSYSREWWERSPSTSNSSYYCAVSQEGTSSICEPIYGYGVSFAFCF